MTNIPHTCQDQPHLLCPACISKNVYEYFTEQLGQPPQDETLRELQLDSPCGKNCKQAILAAKLYLTLVDPHPTVVDPLIASVNDAVVIFWRG